MPTFRSLKNLIFLSVPIILGQVGQMLIGTGDVYIAGLYSTNTVAAIGVANGLINPIFLFGIGLFMGVSPILSIERAQEKDSKNDLYNILIYALVSGIGLSVLCYVLTFVIDYIPLEEVLKPSIKSYIRIVCWSFPFAYLYQGVKEYLQAREEVFWPNMFSIIAVFLNIGINYVLVFGVGDYKGIGEVGLAYASVSIRIILFISVLFLVRKDLVYKFNSDFLKRVFIFSYPVAFMFFLEVLAFCGVSVLSGFFSVTSAATNNIIMNLASIVFMVPLSISSAVAVKVGHAYGKKNYDEIKMQTLSALIISLLFTIFSAATFSLFPGFILRIFTHDQAVIDLGIRIMFVVALFQIFDGLQVTLSGILRGLDKTRITSVMVFIGYWVFGIPFGLYFAYKMNMEVFGLWIGLALSLATVAILLGAFLIKLLRHNGKGLKKSDV